MEEKQNTVPEGKPGKHNPFFSPENTKISKDFGIAIKKPGGQKKVSDYYKPEDLKILKNNFDIKPDDPVGYCLDDETELILLIAFHAYRAKTKQQPGSVVSIAEDGNKTLETILETTLYELAKLYFYPFGNQKPNKKQKQKIIDKLKAGALRKSFYFGKDDRGEVWIFTSSLYDIARTGGDNPKIRIVFSKIFVNRLLNEGETYTGKEGAVYDQSLALVMMKAREAGINSGKRKKFRWNEMIYPLAKKIKNFYQRKSQHLTLQIPDFYREHNENEWRPKHHTRQMEENLNLFRESGYIKGFQIENGAAKIELNYPDNHPIWRE